MALSSRDFKIKWYVPKMSKTVEPESPGRREEKKPRNPDIKNKKRELCVFEKLGTHWKKIKKMTVVAMMRKKDFLFLSVSLKSLGREATISPVKTE